MTSGLSLQLSEQFLVILKHTEPLKPQTKNS